MNLLLLEPQDLTGPQRARIDDARRLEHLVGVRKMSAGDRLAVGELNGALGEAQVESVSETAVELTLNLDTPPPAALPITLVLALPRPQQIRRILQTVAASGVKSLHLFHSRRVEKSYWQSPALTDEAMRQQLILGLEQGADTVLPEVSFHKRFRPFAEDRLPALARDRLALLAHPYDAEPCPARPNRPILLCVGPEGGFNDHEVATLRAQGLRPVHLGPRIQKTETAIPWLLGRLT